MAKGKVENVDKCCWGQFVDFAYGAMCVVIGCSVFGSSANLNC